MDLLEDGIFVLPPPGDKVSIYLLPRGARGSACAS